MVKMRGGRLAPPLLPPPLLLLLLLQLLLCAPPAVRAQGESTTSGCICVSACAYSVDSITYPLCRTSSIPPAVNVTPCGTFSASGQYYWDQCSFNVTSGTVVLLTDFSSVWTAVAVSAVATTAAVFALAGCVAAWHAAPPRPAALWLLPLCAALLGGCHALFVAAIFAAIVAFLYLSMPYALELPVAVALGVACALMLLYASLGRQYARARPLHPSEFTE